MWQIYNTKDYRNQMIPTVFTPNCSLCKPSFVRTDEAIDRYVGINSTNEQESVYSYFQNKNQKRTLFWKIYRYVTYVTKSVRFW